ncbi:MAG: hypothetical protein ABJI96_09305 [Paracoccaceae bacterium]
MKRYLTYLLLAVTGLCLGVVVLATMSSTLVGVVPAENLVICGARQPNTSDKTCIVDGDTPWLNSVIIRLKDFDTPESRTNICGGFA